MLKRPEYSFPKSDCPFCSRSFTSAFVCLDASLLIFFLSSALKTEPFCAADALLVDISPSKCNVMQYNVFCVYSPSGASSDSRASLFPLYPVPRKLIAVFTSFAIQVTEDRFLCWFDAIFAILGGQFVARPFVERAPSQFHLRSLVRNRT